MILRAVHGVMAVLFAMGAIVQFNDPDPIVWILIYSAAGAASLQAATGKPVWQVMAVLALVAMIWGATLALGVIGQQPLFDEEGREMMGLAIIALWMGVGAALARREAGRGEAS